MIYTSPDSTLIPGAPRHDSSSEQMGVLARRQGIVNWRLRGSLGFSVDGDAGCVSTGTDCRSPSFSIACGLGSCSRTTEQGGNDHEDPYPQDPPPQPQPQLVGESTEMISATSACSKWRGSAFATKGGQ